MKAVRVRQIVVLAALTLLAAASAAAQKRDITEKDLLKFVWVADPQISPDGSQVALVRVTVDEKNDQYETAIWLARTDGAEAPRRLTGGTRDNAPRWSPDGRRLAFVRSVEQEGRPQPSQVFVLAMDGGEARAITEMPRGAANPQWSPDGTTIAFSSTAKPEDLKKAEEEKKKEEQEGDAKAGEKPRESDVRVITRPVYRANGVADFGFVDPDRPSHIWTVAVPDAAAPVATPRQVTSGEFAEGNVRWSPDGSRIFFTSNRVQESYYYPNDSDLYAVPAGGGEPVKIADLARHQLADRDLARQYYKKALELRAEDKQALAALESLYEESGDARNLLEIIAYEARTDDDGDYPSRIYTIGMGELVRYDLGTRPEKSEDILKRIANDPTSADFDEDQVEGKYYYARTEADVGPAFQFQDERRVLVDGPEIAAGLEIGYGKNSIRIGNSCIAVHAVLNEHISMCNSISIGNKNRIVVQGQRLSRSGNTAEINRVSILNGKISAAE